jgi:predicted ferric reductase
MNAIDLSADFGLIAIILASVNICVGVLIAVRYSPVRCWPHLRLNIFRLHNRTAYLLVVAIILHPVILLFNPTTHFRWVDIVLPLWSPVQPLENTLGALGLYLILVVVVTSYFRLRLSRLTWKRFHYLVYVASIAVFGHSLLSDPHLKGQVDFLDGEKLLVELCGALTLAFGVYGVKRKRSRLREVQGPRSPAVGVTENNCDSDCEIAKLQTDGRLAPDPEKTDDFTGTRQQLTPSRRSRPQTVNSSYD